MRLVLASLHHPKQLQWRGRVVAQAMHSSLSQRVHSHSVVTDVRRHPAPPVRARGILLSRTEDLSSGFWRPRLRPGHAPLPLRAQAKQEVERLVATALEEKAAAQARTQVRAHKTSNPENLSKTNKTRVLDYHATRFRS